MKGYVHAQWLQSRLTLYTPMDCSPPDSSVHGILQARILEWGAMPFSRGSSRPRDRTLVSHVSCIAGRGFTHWATWEALLKGYQAVASQKKLKIFEQKSGRGERVRRYLLFCMPWLWRVLISTCAVCGLAHVHGRGRGSINTGRCSLPGQARLESWHLKQEVFLGSWHSPYSF